MIFLFFLTFILRLAMVLVLPPLLIGIINRVKAFFGGRRGPPIIQPYYDLWRLLNKGTVQSNVTTWIFRAGPVVALVTTTIAALLIPMVLPISVVSFSGDVLLFVYLMALGRFALVLSSLDTGSAFEGMGVAREVTFACLSEPAMFMGLLALVKVSGSLEMGNMLIGSPAETWTIVGAPLLLIITSLFLLMLADSCRIPFDDPNTHLELTMVHEVIILDHSGPMLALLQLAAAQKLFVFAAMIARIAIPHGTRSGLIEGLLFLPVVLVITVLVGVVESVLARVRMNVIPRVLTAAGIIAAFGLILQETMPYEPLSH